MLEKNEKKYVRIITSTDAEPREGETLGELMARCGAPLDQPCGGRGTCGKCRVKVTGVVPECTDGERLLLSDEEIRAGIRLACVTRAERGMTVERVDADPCGAKTPAGSAHSQARGVGRAEYAVAVDIGTTTLVAYLVNKSAAATTAVSSSANPQSAYGADVISRISFASESEEGLSILKAKVVGAINRLIFNLQRSASVSEEEISEVVISANATMEHLFAGVSPKSIGRAPFEPMFKTFPILTASHMNLALLPRTPVALMPNISGFVGGDVTAGIVYTGMAKREELSLLVDIGTNNEMVLGCRDFLLCCSAAAGPALEGAMISQGMCAAGGAVDHVKSENGRLTVSTVDGTPAVGVCGSGLVDAVGVLLDEKVINASGKFAKALPEGTDFSARLEADKKRFLLSRGKRGGVYITQKDIRKVQLAKSAIATGVELMLEEAGKSVGDIARVYVAGSFGNYITVENAMRIGILPRIAREKITSVGNSSGLGAIEFIIRPELWKEALAVAKGARHIELATHRDFQRTFVKNLSFD